MSKQRKLWRLAKTDSELKRCLAKKLNISEVIAQILINRGLRDEKMAAEFLYGDIENLYDPYLLKDMERAVQRIKCAIKNNEKIIVYGDYDVDGITATALVVRVLKRLGASVDYYIPDRQSEGYGLNQPAIENLYKAGIKLLITVDCGISAVAEVTSAQNKVDIIITDHHQPPGVLPAAYAVINPKRNDCSYPDKNLAGVGVAFKLCQALWHVSQNGGDVFDYLDFVAIGSIADIVPLLGENRILVKRGLELLNKTKNPGLQALFRICNIEKIDAGKVGFVIAPRLNAAGRIGQGTAGVELLLAEDVEYAVKLAGFLEEQNVRRQAVEKDILMAAETLLEEYDLRHNKVIVLSGANWHSGVIGIVASRLLDKYYRPVIVISENDGVGKGSCRSIPNFDIYSALSQCEDILLKFGGHKMAAGLSINVDKISALRERLNNIASESLKDEDYIPVLNIDAMLSLHEIDNAFLEQLACLAPHGMGNPKPLFASASIIPENIKTLGKDRRHLKLIARQQHARQTVISWEMGHMAEYLSNHRIDVAFVPEFNEWQGRRTIQLCAHDIKLSSKLQNGNNRDIATERVVVGQIYLVLKTLMSKQVVCTPNDIAASILNAFGTKVTTAGVIIALEILRELGLIMFEQIQTSLKVSVLPAPAVKLDIKQSSTFNQGKLTDQIIMCYKNWRTR